MRHHLDHRFSIAPMMDWTDRHFRYFARLISQNAVLYTEMVTTGALIHGDKNRHLRYDNSEHPLALQLGGSKPDELAFCCTLAEEWGYDEVNLNVGCPSDRVQNNMIGACLMAHPELVKRCLDKMSGATPLPITIKHRIGIDTLDSLEFLLDYVGKIKNAGCTTFIVHARKAVLSGLSPKQNRDIPPLLYDRVYALKKEFQELEIIINGGIKTIAEAQRHLSYVDGVMVGREAYQNPWLLSQVDTKIYQDNRRQELNRHQVIRAMFPYIVQELSHGQHLGHITRHLLGIFHGQPGGKKFRRYLSENAHRKGADIRILEQALALVPENE